MVYGSVAANSTAKKDFQESGGQRQLCVFAFFFVYFFSVYECLREKGETQRGGGSRDRVTTCETTCMSIPISFREPVGGSGVLSSAGTVDRF